MMRLRPALAIFVFAQAAAAEDRIHLDGMVSDVDFYRAIACAAPPGGDCTRPFVRWPAARLSDLRVALVRVDPGFPEAEAGQADAALDYAVAEINAAESGITLRRVPGDRRADVGLYLLDVPRNSTLRDTGIRDMDGIEIGAAHVRVWWNRNNSILQGVIVMTRGIAAEEYPSIMLEELYQSLGLLIDVTGAVYETSTIVHEFSNVRTSLGDQDRASLRLHYPPD